MADLEKIGLAEWRLKKDYIGEEVRIFAEEALLKTMDEEVFIQAKNVAQLPGLAGPVIIMPDAHSGYGAPIGTVFATKEKDGYVAPGAVGYDINCGMRLIRTNLFYRDLKSFLERLVNELFEMIPVGLGKRGFYQVNKRELKELAEGGVPYLLREKNLGWSSDLDRIEEKGKIEGADFSNLSAEAVDRGISQLATLGSGNHYLEIQKVDQIFDQKKANELGILGKDQIMVMFHCGSRGLGHQVCGDYLKIFEKEQKRIKIKINDRQLVFAPISSVLGQNYLSAMSAAANFAFVNRQLITYQIRKAFEKILGKKSEEMGMEIIYDVAHNIAKFEEHQVPNSKKRGRFLIHRKGATRSFPDQPVIIGGSMETGSYLLVGTGQALEKSYGSTAHGSGRTMSRARAKKMVRGEKLLNQLRGKGIYIRAASFSGLAEEAGFAYKDISAVVKSVSMVGLSQPVVSLKPVGNIKG